MTRYGMTLLAAGLFIFVSQAMADDKADKDKIQGEWSLVTLETNGESQKVAEDNEHYIKLKIEGEKFHITLGGGEHDATFAIDSSKKPKTIDVTLMGGDQNGTVMKGFFELEGDNLKICMGKPETPDRPAEFKSKDDVKIFTFKRAKK
jgi:uncharacterized protein (TIGR03067 family)